MRAILIPALLLVALTFFGLPVNATVPGMRTTINLSNSWKFQIDPTNIGVSSHWFSDTFDDSAWQTLLSGKSWESQGVAYAGYAWYRQYIIIPASAHGQPLTITLASIFSDDDFYFNGVRVAGLKGEYKYLNMMTRVYSIPASSVRYGASNTIAIRTWGGNLGFHKTNSGLVAGVYTIVGDSLGLWARQTGGSTISEKPIRIFDLSSCRQGKPFELVVRINPSEVPPSPKMEYTLTDFYGIKINSGTVPVTIGTDSIARGIVSVDDTSSMAIYFAGRFNLQWQLLSSGQPEWTDTGAQIDISVSSTIRVKLEVFQKTFPAGIVSLPPEVDSANAMYNVIIPDTTVNITNLVVNDLANAANWSLQANLQVGNVAYGDRVYTVSVLPSSFVGAQWIRTPNNSKSYALDPVAAFSIDKPTNVFLGIDTRLTRKPWVRLIVADHLSFFARDNTTLPALPVLRDPTPYGTLKLVDVIDCSMDMSLETHPYLQSGFGPGHSQDGNTPGTVSNSTVSTILGKPARQPGYGWFAYRIGRAGMTIGKTYLLRIEYPEDVARYFPIEIEAGQNYMDVGFEGGISTTDPYDNWPLSNQWQFYDVIVPLGAETIGVGGAGDGNALRGIFVYFMDKRKPGYYLSPWSGGAAVATLRLYEIDPIANAPRITVPPAPLPRRVMTFDWERQATAHPADMINYAKLMGYSAISPPILKWGFANYAEPLAGFDSMNVDFAHYWVTSPYTHGSGVAPAPAVAGAKSQHLNYLSQTKLLDLDYIPRFEYGGSYDLPISAQAIGADGNIAKPDRYATYGANLLNPATFAEMKAFLDSFIKPYTVTYPNLKGVLWRVRQDRMQISYGAADAMLFSADTGTPLPNGFSTFTPAQVANWSSVSKGPAYADWWHGKRRDFHQKLVNLLKSYRSDLVLYYYNWDVDKWSLMEPDTNASAFFSEVAKLGGPKAYANDRAARSGFTAADYLNVIATGHFIGSFKTVKRPDTDWQDYALRPSLYNTVSGIELFAPVNRLCYALPDYINYFQTQDGLAVSNAVSYDEIGARMINPKFEGSMVLPGGGPFSMAMELLSYYYGDVRTLTYTAYTYGRGFADAHRRFAQAFRALPAVPGTLVAGTPTDVAARVYPTVSNGTYIGIAYKGYAAQALTVLIPGAWTPAIAVTDLVSNQQVPTMIDGNGNLVISLNAGPMELNAFSVR
jgi:hypothetical protein